MVRWPVGPARLAGHDYSAPGAYFVTVCSFEKGMTFAREEVRRVIESGWAEIPVHFPSVRLDAFVIMPNHLHGVLFLTLSQAGESVGPLHAAVLQTPGRTKTTLNNVVRSFKSAVTRELRIRGLHDASPVWQPNFHDRVVRNEAELNRVREYIAQNPIAWPHDLENPDRTANEEHERSWGWLETNSGNTSEAARNL